MRAAEPSANRHRGAPMTFDRLKAIGRSKGMQKRLEAEKRLKVLAQETVEKHSSAVHELSLNSCNV